MNKQLVINDYVCYLTHLNLMYSQHTQPRNSTRMEQAYVNSDGSLTGSYKYISKSEEIDRAGVNLSIQRAVARCMVKKSRPSIHDYRPVVTAKASRPDASTSSVAEPPSFQNANMIVPEKKVTNYVPHPKFKVQWTEEEDRKLVMWVNQFG